MTAAACVACGTTLRESAKFCDECGAAVPASAAPAEYKQVTVLFADVVHSMDIAAAVGAERLREIMTALVDRAARVVQRYGGTADQFTGDGLMALFGVPVALEDHAFRACLAALEVQEESKVLAEEVRRRDGVELQLRIGLNSGEVIVGQLGASPFGRTAVGEQVGMAQRMESVAPPGGVMLSQSTARLVEHGAILDGEEKVRIKGRDSPVLVRRLRGVSAQRGDTGRQETALVGRGQEVATLTEILDRAIAGTGGVVGIVGAPGIGKSRLVRETVARANTRGVAVFSTFCQSHTRDIAFHAAAGLLRAVFDTDGLPGGAARERVRTRLPDADAEDLVLLDDLLGIREADVEPVVIDADARRRRLTRLIRSAALARRTPTLYVIDDVHWLDEASESMLEEFVSVLPRTHSLALFTYRPEYHGALARTAGSRTISIVPLDSSDTAALTAALLGEHRSVAGLMSQVAERSGGNPFFTEEIVRDLVERDVLSGSAGSYICHLDSAHVTVPATVQATIAARIDRLGRAAKRTLHTAAVIGSRFVPDLLSRVDGRSALAELVDADLVDLVPGSPHGEHAFRHPLIRAVAYESQLKADRAVLHQRVAEAIQQDDPAADDENAALIAGHLEAAGDVRAAFDWHMRAAGWLMTRDIRAAKTSWQKARDVADQLPADEPGRLPMRIAPRTLLCGFAWRAGGEASVADTGYDELRELCLAAGDQMSLVMGTSGLLVAMGLNHRLAELQSLTPEYIRLLESTGDPALLLLSNCATFGVFQAGAIAGVMPLFQQAIDAADGNPTLGNFFFESPLAWVTTLRGLARSSLGDPNWRDDLRDALTMAREVGGMTQASVVTYGYGVALLNGTLVPDATTLEHSAFALDAAERSGDDVSLAWSRVSHGIMLIRSRDGDSAGGLELLRTGRRQAAGHADLLTVTMADVQLAECEARSGDLDAAIEIAAPTVAHCFASGEAIFRGPAVAVLADALLSRGTAQDMQDARNVVDRLAASHADPGFVFYELPLLRLRAQLARVRGDEQAYRELADRYRAMATSAGFEGHIASAR
ncbi:AAA ATPase-like protein [Mycobacterium sp. BK086]|uniref:AAA family ATPase n=1 Tax=Mycobacterium sp. BK086 TaxID=2512165 RepID=UPI00105E6054|nr:adenylate/guanylate cyclase domain-containing protein [Mycobacterium sp. BK086]TDO07969.1 AAA ATPase-like protein [Mycobacterium sp. BK086]